MIEKGYNYHEIVKICINEYVEQYLVNHIELVEQLSHETGFSEQDVCKYIRLSIPYYLSSDFHGYIDSNSLYSHLKNKLFQLSIYMKQYNELSGIDKCRKDCILIRKGNKIYCDREKVIVSDVDRITAKFIEKKLHYAGCYRNNAIYRIGLFIDGFTYPFCYMSYTSLDRNNKIQPLYDIFSNIEITKVVELARVYGISEMPRNSISLLTAIGSKYFRNLGYEFMITAVNPYLGFGGYSMIASGFHPYAYREVQYTYTEQMEYIARRDMNGLNVCCCNKMPPNILFVKEIAKQKATTMINKMYYVNLEKL